MRLRRTRPGSNRSHGDGASNAAHLCTVLSAPPRLVVWDFVYRRCKVNRECLRELLDYIEVNVGAITSKLRETTSRIDFTITWLNHITPCHDHQDLKHLSWKLRVRNLQHFLDFRSRKQVRCLWLTECDCSWCADEALDVDYEIRSTFKLWNVIED